MLTTRATQDVPPRTKKSVVDQSPNHPDTKASLQAFLEPPSLHPKKMALGALGAVTLYQVARPVNKPLLEKLQQVANQIEKEGDLKQTLHIFDKMMNSINTKPSKMAPEVFAKIHIQNIGERALATPTQLQREKAALEIQKALDEKQIIEKMLSLWNPGNIENIPGKVKKEIQNHLVQLGKTASHEVLKKKMQKVEETFRAIVRTNAENALEIKMAREKLQAEKAARLAKDLKKQTAFQPLLQTISENVSHNQRLQLWKPPPGSNVTDVTLSNLERGKFFKIELPQGKSLWINPQKANLHDVLTEIRKMVPDFELNMSKEQMAKMESYFLNAQQHDSKILQNNPRKAMEMLTAPPLSNKSGQLDEMPSVIKNTNEKLLQSPTEKQKKQIDDLTEFFKKKAQSANTKITRNTELLASNHLINEDFIQTLSQKKQAGMGLGKKLPENFDPTAALPGNTGEIKIEMIKENLRKQKEKASQRLNFYTDTSKEKITQLLEKINSKTIPEEDLFIALQRQGQAVKTDASAQIKKIMKEAIEKAAVMISK